MRRVLHVLPYFSIASVDAAAAGGIRVGDWCGYKVMLGVLEFMSF